MWREPRSCVKRAQSVEMNWRPRSVVIVEGVPNRDIQPLMKAAATDSAVICVNGIASDQRVNLSMQVRR